MTRGGRLLALGEVLKEQPLGGRHRAQGSPLGFPAKKKGKHLLGLRPRG